MKCTKKYFFIFILICITGLVYAQEIKVTEFRINPLDVSARENAVIDANGDACALIKLRTGLQNIKFTTDLGILKIENHDGEFWLWVSPNTSKIRIEAEGIGRLEYILPEYAEEYNVYVIFLTAIMPEKVIYRDVNTLSVLSKPKRAEIYIDSIFMGYSPMSISIPTDSFKYEVRAKRYSPVTGNFKLNQVRNELVVSLKKSPDANRVFILLNSGLPNRYNDFFFGLEVGTIGKKGWYLSVVPPLRLKKSIAYVNFDYFERKAFSGSLLSTDIVVKDEEKFASIVNSPSSDFNITLAENNNNYYTNFRFKFGLTERVFRNTYLRAGIGFLSIERWFKLILTPEASNSSTTVPLDEIFYGRTYTYNFFSIETGLLYRFSNSYLISLGLNTTGISYYYTGKAIGMLYPLECSIGLGYNF